MIAHLRGRILSKQPGQVVVEAGGVGYDVTISVPTFTALPAEGAETALHIHTQVREDLLALFGFFELAEKAALRAAHHRHRGRPQAGGNHP
jgi:Holliday junction DNA helicase RuvA